MRGVYAEYWHQLCAMAAIEQDPEKFRALVIEISRMLQEKEDRLKGQGKEDRPKVNKAKAS